MGGKDKCYSAGDYMLHQRLDCSEQMVGKGGGGVVAHTQSKIMPAACERLLLL